MSFWLDLRRSNKSTAVVALVSTIVALICVAALSACARPGTVQEKPTYPSMRYLFAYNFIADRTDSTFKISHHALGETEHRLKLMPKDRTMRPIRVMTFSDGTIVLMNEELCQSHPTMLFKNTHRWGPIFYANEVGQRDFVLATVKDLVGMNCAPGVVKTIRIAVHIGETSEQRIGQGSGGKYVYTGKIHVGEKLRLVHDDPDGMSRYLRYNNLLEQSVDRRRARRQIQERWRNANAKSLRDYCSKFPQVCVGFGLLGVLAVAGSSGETQSTQSGFARDICLARCSLYPEKQRAWCISNCDF